MSPNPPYSHVITPHLSVSNSYVLAMDRLKAQIRELRAMVRMGEKGACIVEPSGNHIWEDQVSQQGPDTCAADVNQAYESVASPALAQGQDSGRTASKTMTGEGNDRDPHAVEKFFTENSDIGPNSKLVQTRRAKSATRKRLQNKTEMSRSDLNPFKPGARTKRTFNERGNAARHVQVGTGGIYRELYKANLI